jgi:hypothetical protein
MVGLGTAAPGSAGLAGLLARCAPSNDGLGATNWGSLDRLKAPPPPQRSDRGQNATAPQGTDGAMAQISQMAQSLFQQMRQQGVTDQSFDLHLDLSKLGVSVDGRGNKSMEGHSLTIDLHVEAHVGTMQTDKGAVQFGQLDVQFEMTQTDVYAQQSTQAGAGAQPPALPSDLPGDGKTASVADALKQLADLFDRATAGSDKQQFNLGDLLSALGDQIDQMHSLLEQVGRSFQNMAARQQGAQGNSPAQDRSNGAAGGRQDSDRSGGDFALQATDVRLELQIRSLTYTRAPKTDATQASPAGQTTEAASAAA